MKNYFFFTLLLLLISCNKNETVVMSTSIPNVDERIKAGGGTTMFESGLFSFDNPAPNLNAKNLKKHLSGDREFEQAYVTAPADVNPGLGPQFNNVSCIACHPKDGRTPRPDNLNSLSGFFLRTSLPGENSNGGPIPVPGFGNQLTQRANVGKKPETQFEVSYQDIPVTFADGTVVTLKKPIYTVSNTYIPMPANALFSPRLAPPVFGLGLLEAITEADIIKNEDIDDTNNDGISGKANRVWDPEKKKIVLGRFGWKASGATVMAQSAGAFHNDIGITNPLFPVESSFGQTNGDNTENKEPEISQKTLDDVALYCRTLAVPAARDLDDAQVIRGYEVFEQAKCSACHTPKFVTGTYPGIPAISNQTIYPYTDMLLHDMGDDMADGRPDFLANGNEWKTRPLWGLGLTEKVNGHTHFLHDGRAKNVEEAILWHGGEADESKKTYLKLSKSDRAAMLKFINAL